MTVEGARVIRRLLVANRGEIARRIFRTCRELGIATVAVHSDPDADELFVREADLAVALGGTSSAESYLRGDAIVDAALRTGADAVHPGYGFLAEDPAFARAVVAAGLCWIGPAPETIEAMGSKLRARDLMEAAGVPVLPGGRINADRAAAEDGGGASDAGGAGVATAAGGEGGAGPGMHELAARIGFPLLVKASAGGGGRGMRLVREPGGLEDAVVAASREAASAFGDGTVFLERYVTRPRHVEVQILGDRHGTVSVLPERDCSIQRRHQKLIEESPAPGIDDAVRARLADAARSAGSALGYVGAGTVEFVLAPGGDVFFLEVNTRLQVEHPVTELVCGLDLVALQLRIAEGERLPPEACDPAPRGHAVEARLVAEDAAAGWLPQTGTFERFVVGEGGAAGTTMVRVDSAVGSGSVVSPHYDSLLAKVVVHAPTRAAAVRRLASVLARAELAGPRTTRDLLVRVLESQPFAAASHDTQLLDGPALRDLALSLVERDELPWMAAAAALAGQAEHRERATVLRAVPSGWRNVPSAPQQVEFVIPHAEGDPEVPLSVAYRLARDGTLVELAVDGAALPAARARATPTRVELWPADGVRRRFSVLRRGERVWVGAGRGQVELVERPRFPSATGVAGAGSTAAPLPGTVLRVLARVGDAVTARQPLIVLEAMKMEHEVVAQADGTLTELSVTVGDAVDAGQVLLVVDPAPNHDEERE